MHIHLVDDDIARCRRPRRRRRARIVGLEALAVDEEASFVRELELATERRLVLGVGTYRQHDRQRSRQCSEPGHTSHSHAFLPVLARPSFMIEAALPASYRQLPGLKLQVCARVWDMAHGYGLSRPPNPAH